MIQSRSWDIKRLVRQGALACTARGTDHSKIRETQGHAPNARPVTCLHTGKTRAPTIRLCP